MESAENSLSPEAKRVKPGRRRTGSSSFWGGGWNMEDAKNPLSPEATSGRGG
jgi:hypothetical protein